MEDQMRLNRLFIYFFLSIAIPAGIAGQAALAASSAHAAIARNANVAASPGDLGWQ